MDNNANQALEKAIELAEKGDYREAIELLFELVDRNPDFVMGYELIGDYNLRNSHPELAIRPLEIALEINQDSFVSHFLLGCAYGRTLRFEDALEELEIAREMNPRENEVLRNIGWITCMQGNLEEGRKYLREAMDVEPQNGLIYNDLAASYMFSSERDLTKAEFWLKKALEVEPEDPFIQQTHQAFQEMLEEFEAVNSTAPK